MARLLPPLFALAVIVAGAPPPGPVAASSPQKITRQAGAPVYGFKVIRSYPHDPRAYTQGLLYHDGLLYEGTGLNGRSSIRKVRLETGEVLQVRPLDQRYFGEGIVIWKDRLVQLTWRSEIGFVYDSQSFQP